MPYKRVPTVGKKLTFRVELAKQMIGTYNSLKYHGRPTRESQSGTRRTRMKLPHYPTRAADVSTETVLKAKQPHGTVVNVNSGYATQEMPSLIVS